MISPSPFINPSEFSPHVVVEATKYFQSQHPLEGCGIVVDDQFVPIENVHPQPRTNYLMPEDTWIDYNPLAILHSHTNGIHEPSKADLQCQIDCGIPFGIIMCNGETATKPIWFGNHILDTPLLKRPFIFGVFDCFSLGRSWYWQNRGVYVPNFAREVDFWRKKEDLFGQHMSECGFREVVGSEYQEGDILLMSMWSNVPNHCAIVLGGNLLMHHKTNCPSVMEPMLDGWMRITKKVLRHVP